MTDMHVSSGVSRCQDRLRPALVGVGLMLLAGCASTPPPARVGARAASRPTIATVTPAMILYGTNQDPAVVGRVMKALDSKRVFASADRLHAMTLGFVSCAIRQQPRRAGDWLGELADCDESTIKAYYRALWLANRPEATAVLIGVKTREQGARQKYVRALLESRAPDFRTMTLDNPDPIHFCWGAYWASRDSYYVDRLIDFLPRRGVKADEMTVGLWWLTIWSLTSNAARSSDIMAICEKRLDAVPPDQTHVLLDIVAAAKRGRPQPSYLFGEPAKSYIERHTIPTRR